MTIYGYARVSTAEVAMTSPASPNARARCSAGRGSTARAKFRSLGDPWADTTTPHGELMVTVLAGLATFERHLIKARTADGRARAKARGVAFGRKPTLTRFQLEEALKSVGREPHSVIGSSCIGASVVGGICNNSGGALIHRGPAYTELALFARVDETGQAQLVNHLGIRLGGNPEEILDAMDRDAFTELDIEYDPKRLASDNEYLQHVRIRSFRIVGFTATG